MFKQLVLFSFCFVILGTNAHEDIQKQYYKRSHQYTPHKYRKILVSTPARSGSTLVFNVLRFLFEDLDVLDKDTFCSDIGIVKKTHSMRYEGPPTIIFVTIRNPIDACLSLYRVQLSLENPEISKERLLNKTVSHFMTHMHKLNKILQMKASNLVILKYEGFAANLENLLARIEKVFNIKIRNMDRKLIKKTFSKKNVASYTEHLKNFANFDRRTHFHGAHVEQGEFSEDEKALIREKIREKLKGKCGFLKKYGYVL